MSSRPGTGTSFAGRAAPRVEVFLALPDPVGGPLILPADRRRPERLPGVVLAHGEHPRDAAVRAAAGVVEGSGPTGRSGGDRPLRDRLRLRGVLSDVRPVSGGPGLHVLRLLFEPDRGLPLLVDDPLLTSPEPAPVRDDAPGAPPRVQRPAAYALVVRDQQVLLTCLVGGVLWTLPGGGIDHGEHPDDAVRREIIEETGLELTAAELVDVDSRHFTGRSPQAVLEDFHGVRLLYRGTVSGRQAPAVQEVGGTTEAASWWPLAALDRLQLSSVVRTALSLMA